ncbi:ImmA/IrrE family metallo-endopeptidase [Clostridium beijerinckii]|uniref:ImmA/IrrE family metallo-endopeptidase n=1 Tax=Clostridium beijerinckii TaxID=1520 RepID=UPI000318860B|nr:ImmA/IrrE family metallo-endopeptidase [Clostridium beijerinckii]
MHFIEELFSKLVKKHKTTDVFELCRLEHIIYREMNLHPEINGIYQYVMRNKIITINSNLNVNDKRITCEHELGHAVMHKKYNCTYLKTKTFINVNKLEKQADIFSSLFEIPILTKDMLIGKTLIEVAHDLNVSRELLELRLCICDFV